MMLLQHTLRSKTIFSRHAVPLSSAFSNPLTSALSFSSSSSSSSPSSPPRPFKTVGVLGLGLMGHGIAQVALQAGYKVIAVDLDASRVNDTATSLTHALAKVHAARPLSMTPEALVASQLHTSTSLETLATADLVIEAIVEELGAKETCYQSLNAICAPEAILASNTSSLSIATLAAFSQRPTTTVGLHFFNPVPQMKLVEIVQTKETDPKVLTACHDFVTSLRKTAVNCGDTPGFIVNRLLVPYIAQALLMLERGDATAVDIDRSMTLGTGSPMGPITLADYVGLDTCLSILQGWVDTYPTDPAFVVPDILRQQVAAGHLGRKSGKGFYTWNGNKVVMA